MDFWIIPVVFCAQRVLVSLMISLIILDYILVYIAFLNFSLTVPFEYSCTVMILYNEHPAMEFTRQKHNNNGIIAVGVQCREYRRALSLKQSAVSNHCESCDIIYLVNMETRRGSK